MSLYNEIQVGRFNGILHKLLGMKEGAPAAQLSGDIVPGLILENDRPEWKFLSGERLCHGGMQAADIAAALAKVGLFNPAGSGVLGVVTGGHFSAGSASRVSLYTTNRGNSLASKSSGSIMDGRANTGFDLGGPFPTIQLDSESVAGFVGRAIDQFNVLAATVVWVPMQFVLPPDCGIHFANTASNQTLCAGFNWTERSIESSEER